jgi:hypothetical protein
VCELETYSDWHHREADRPAVLTRYTCCQPYPHFSLRHACPSPVSCFRWSRVECAAFASCVISPGCSRSCATPDAAAVVPVPVWVVALSMDPGFTMVPGAACLAGFGEVIAVAQPASIMSVVVVVLAAATPSNMPASAVAYLSAVQQLAHGSMPMSLQWSHVCVVRAL